MSPRQLNGGDFFRLVGPVSAMAQPPDLRPKLFRGSVVGCGDLAALGHCIKQQTRKDSWVKYQERAFHHSCALLRVIGGKLVVPIQHDPGRAETQCADVFFPFDRCAGPVPPLAQPPDLRPELFRGAVAGGGVGCVPVLGDLEPGSHQP